MVEDKYGMQGQIEYVKPEVVDLGAVNTSLGLCQDGSGDSGDCAPAGDQAGTLCNSGSDAKPVF
jgi:hypothetical protein